MYFEAFDSFKNFISLFVLALNLDGDHLLRLIGESSLQIHFIVEKMNINCDSTVVDNSQSVYRLNTFRLFKVSNGESLCEVFSGFA